MVVLRLQKLLAERGVTSRRTAEEWIAAGRVTVNGHIVREMGYKVDAAKDSITIDGKPLPAPPQLRYLALHKPPGYLCAAKDQRGKQSVLRLLPELPERVYPVGRLDYETAGLLLLTNDGALTHTLLHPSRQVDKTYLAEVRGPASVGDLEQLRRGVELEDGRTAPAQVTLKRRSQGSSQLEITIHEGRNRQIRRMCEAVGHPVQNLKRIRFGPIALGNLKPGEWRELTTAEVRLLKQNGNALGKEKRPRNATTNTRRKYHGKPQSKR